MTKNVNLGRLCVCSAKVLRLESACVADILTGLGIETCDKVITCVS